MTEPKAFVATSFEKEDSESVESFLKAIGSGGFRPFIDRAGSPENPPTKVRESILSSDCLIAIAFRRERLSEGGWRSSTWIANEVGIAWAYGKPILAFIEDEVVDPGILKTVGSYTLFSREKLGSSEETNKIHAALVALRQRVGPAALYEQLEWIDRVLTPIGKGLISSLAQQGDLHPSDGELRFYETALKIVATSSVVRFAVKLPSLFLPDALDSEGRRRFRETLIERLRAGGFEAHYMFSIPRTMEVLQSYSDRSSDEQEMAVAMLQEIVHPIEVGVLDLRYAASDDFVCCVIGTDQMASLWESPQDGRAVATIYDNRPLVVEQFERFFDRVFGETKRVSREDVEEWIRTVRGIESHGELERR